jgi:hypothetical protein
MKFGDRDRNRGDAGKSRMVKIWKLQEGQEVIALPLASSVGRKKLVIQQPVKCRVTRRAQVPRRPFDMIAAGETSPHRMDLLGPASGVVASDCMTKFENAQGTKFGELLYPWHPWAGLRIGLHESVSKPFDLRTVRGAFAKV